MRLKALVEIYTMHSFAQLQNHIFFKKISRICRNLRNFSEFLRNSQFFKPIFCENFEIAAVQKHANLVQLEQCCQTHILLRNFVLIQPRASPPKICIFEKCIFEKCIFEKCIFEKCIFEKCIFRKYIFRKFCKFLAGSFSAALKRNFARKYAFDSIFQALQDLHPFAPLQSQNFRKKSVWKIANDDQRVFRAVANREPDRSNARRNESTSDENIFSRKVRRTAAWIESEAAPRENPTN